MGLDKLTIQSLRDCGTARAQGQLRGQFQQRLPCRILPISKTATKANINCWFRQRRGRREFSTSYCDNAVHIGVWNLRAISAQDRESSWVVGVRFDCECCKSGVWLVRRDATLIVLVLTYDQA